MTELDKLKTWIHATVDSELGDPQSMARARNGVCDIQRRAEIMSPGTTQVHAIETQHTVRSIKSPKLAGQETDLSGLLSPGPPTSIQSSLSLSFSLPLSCSLPLSLPFSLPLSLPHWFANTVPQSWPPCTSAASTALAQVGSRLREAGALVFTGVGGT